MDPKYRPEPFGPLVESTAAAVSRDVVDQLRGAHYTAAVESTTPVMPQSSQAHQTNQAWPVIEFAISRRRLWQEIWIPVVVVGASLLLVFGELESKNHASLVFCLTICLFLLPPALRAVGRALLPNRKGSVRLDVDGVVFNPGLARQPHDIRYEQIWNVDVSQGSNAVNIKYYPVGFAGQIDEGCVRAVAMDFVQDAEGLANELTKRARGAPPNRSVLMKQAVRSLLRMFAWLMLFGIAWFETAVVFLILVDVKSLLIPG